MKVYLSERRTFDGLTYRPGEHEVDERTGRKLLHNFPNVCIARVPDERAAAEHEVATEAEYTVTISVPVDDESLAHKVVVENYEYGIDDEQLDAVEQSDDLADEPEHDSILNTEYYQPETLATPSAKGLADELGIDLSQIVGTGKDGKIMVSDVRKAAKK